MLFSIQESLAAIILLSICASSSGCDDHDQSRNLERVWRSVHFPVSIRIPDDWREVSVNTPGDTYDLPDKTLTAFLHKSKRFSYMIRIEKGVGFNAIPRSRYIDIVEAQIRDQPSHEFIARDEIEMHNRIFDRLIFRMTDAKQDLMMHTYVFRNDEVFVNIQVTAPYNRDDPGELPIELKAFDSGLRLKL